MLNKYAPSVCTASGAAWGRIVELCERGNEAVGSIKAGNLTRRSQLVVHNYRALTMLLRQTRAGTWQGIQSAQRRCLQILLVNTAVYNFLLPHAYYRLCRCKKREISVGIQVGPGPSTSIVIYQTHNRVR